MSQTEHDPLCRTEDPWRSLRGTFAVQLLTPSERVIQLLTEVSGEFQRAAYSITATIRDEVIFEPWKPQRRPGWTARQYRAARRAYRRQCKAWAKAGRTSTVEHRLYAPNASIAIWDRGES